jgi:hypothetical protein
VNPTAHLLVSWIVAIKTTDNLRDRRLVTLAGVAPDLDGLGIVLDWAKGGFSTDKYFYYQSYHHWTCHGLPAALVCSILMALLARQRWRVLWLSFLTYHLHFLCDLVGSRGPDKTDIWPIFYFGPLSQRPMLFWRHQWRLDGWQNLVFFLVMFAWSLSIAVKRSESFIAIFNRRFDALFVQTLRKWSAKWRGAAAAKDSRL